MPDIDKKLSELGLTLPTAPKPVASYIPCVQTGNLLIVSGQLPLVDGKLTHTGRVPDDVSLEEAQQAMVQCVLNALAIFSDTVNEDWDKLGRVVRLGAFVACGADFTQQPQVANGASDLMMQLFGEAGRHARAAVGVSALPLGSPVELEATFELRA